MSNYKGKIVEVKRHFNMHAMAQSDPEVQAWFGQSLRQIGPYYENKAPGSGLTFDEQKILLPGMIGIEASDKDFRRIVTDFYHTFATKVPKDGLKLQVSLADDNAPLSETNLPINLADYIAYRHMLKHRDVAPDLPTAERNINAKFYIVNPDNVTKGAIEINELEDKATVLYMKYKDDQIKLDQILTMLGISIKGMKVEDKVLKLKEFSKKNADLNELEQRNEFSTFIKTAEDKDLEYKYLITEMIGAQYLKKVGNSINYNESGENISDDMEGAVIFFKNPKNSRALNLLRAQYILKIKRGEEYLPKEARVEKVEKVKEQTE